MEELGLKAPISSPSFTGTPTAPTAAAGTNTTQIATTAFVTSAAGSVVKTASGTIATNATSVEVSFSGTLINAYATQGSSFVVVDKVIGTGKVTFSVAAVPSTAVTCVVVYS